LLSLERNSITAMLDGVRVLEVGTWVMVPSAGVLLADLGADVIKVEHPRRGDPVRALVVGGVIPAGPHSPMVEHTNRGKRSVCVDFATAEGREVLYRLAETCDVFLTNLLPDVRERLQIDVDHVRARNPKIVYMRVDALGPEGPDRGKPGFDSSVFFGRAGILNALTPHGDEPIHGRPGLGDRVAALMVGYGVAAALFHRERTGEAPVIDASLFGAGLWSGSLDVAYSGALGEDFSRAEQPVTNPIGTQYRTADGRWIMLAMLQSDRWWPDFCRHLGRDDLIDDPRFADAGGRAANREACVAEIRATFASAPLEEWRKRLATLRGPWEVVQDCLEVYDDPQAVANGYLVEVDYPGGERRKVVNTPLHFDGQPPVVGIAPEWGQHTEEVLLELGFSWDQIAELQAAGAIP
jgi:crotonobetainyl-CoA:carnitine CoA-transferase CaiB-like acyl-CoA transferase